ncbi:MAG: hypothetical protein AAF663_03080 [Planctomycetota bacterium]
MVASAVPRLTGRPPLCTARVLLDAANAAHVDGFEVLAAVRLREAIRRYLIANCTHEGVKLPPLRRRRPEVLIRLQRRAGVEISTWVDEILESLEAVLRCERPACSIGCCLELSFDIFGDLFSREGGRS